MGADRSCPDSPASSSTKYGSPSANRTRSRVTSSYDLARLLGDPFRQFLRLLVIEPSDLHGEHVRGAPEERGGVAARFVIAARHHDQDGQSTYRAGQVRHQGERVTVGPLRILEEENAAVLASDLAQQSGDRLAQYDGGIGHEPGRLRTA